MSLSFLGHSLIAVSEIKGKDEKQILGQRYYSYAINVRMDGSGSAYLRAPIWCSYLILVHIIGFENLPYRFDRYIFELGDTNIQVG